MLGIPTMASSLITNSIKIRIFHMNSLNYAVNKKELKNGNNPVLEIEEKDFKIYSRP